MNINFWEDIFNRILRSLLIKFKQIILIMNSGSASQASLKTFGSILLVLEVLILVFYAIFVRMTDHSPISPDPMQVDELVF